MTDSKYIVHATLGGKDLNEVFREEQARRAAEKERLRAEELRKAREQVARAGKSVPPLAGKGLPSVGAGGSSAVGFSSSVSDIVSATVFDLEEFVQRVEPRVSRDSNGAKKLFHYDDALDEVRRNGYHRFLRPYELMAILIHAFEHPQGFCADLARDIYLDPSQTNQESEWVSLYFEVSDDRTVPQSLTVFIDYEHAEARSLKGVLYKGKDYFSKEFPLTVFRTRGHGRFRRTVQSSIPLIKDVFVKEINKVHPELVTLLFSRPFDQLPNKMQKGSVIMLPNAGTGKYIGFEGRDSYYFFSDLYDRRAIRGVREKSSATTGGVS